MGKHRKDSKKSRLSPVEIGLAACGDKDALSRVFEHYDEDVERCIKYRCIDTGMLLSEEDIEECRQEVYAFMMHAIKRFKLYR